MGVTIRPFRALRPKVDYVEEFSCPPYDVLEEWEVKEIVSKKPNSFLRVTRAEVEFEEPIDPHSDVVYKKAYENLRKFEESGILIQEEKESIYIYREEWQSHTQTGIFATVSAWEYLEGKIKKHELTRQEKEDDRTRHILTLKAQTGPVFLTFKSKNEIKDIIKEAIEKSEKLYDFVDENGVRHELWKVSNENLINKITAFFKNNVEALYIADGHHRAAAASRVAQIKAKENPNHTGNEDYNFFMAAIFPHDELRILDYNRVVKDLNGLTKESFLEKINENFEVEEVTEKPYKPKKVHEFGMYLGNGEWYRLTAKEKIINENDPVESLDVYILQNYLLDPILGIKNPRKDKRINFIGGIKGLKELEKWVDEMDWRVAFSMYPTSIEQLMRVADENKIMPPKSTWFEPKLRSGLLIHKI